MCYSFSMSPKLSDKKLAVLGAGKLGGILLRAYLKQGLFVSNRVIATVKHAEKAAALAKELGIAVTTDNREAVKGADIVLLTIKPQTVAEVLQEIAPEIGADTLWSPSRPLCRQASSSSNSPRPQAASATKCQSCEQCQILRPLFTVA
jgi:predicted dinucleotide-binding enzyme